MNTNNLKITVFHFIGSHELYNGASLQAQNLAKHLNGFNINYLVSNSDVKWLTELDLKPTKVLLLPHSGFRRYLSLFISIYRFKPNIFHLHGFWVGVDILFIAWLLRIKSVVKTTLIDVDDLATITRSSRVKAWISQRATVYNSLVQPLYEINKKYAKKSQVVCIPNLVDCPEQIIELKEKQNICLAVGSVVPRKKIAETIHLFLDNLSNELNVRLVIVGKFDVKDAYYQHCLTLIPKDKLEKISFIGQISHSEVIQYLKLAKGLFLLSAQEGMPNSVLEAMANNCVPILSPMKGIAKCMVPSAKHGIILDDQSIPNFQNIKSTKVSWPVLDALIDEGHIYERARSMYSADVVVDKYRHLYSMLADNQIGRISEIVDD